MTICSEITPNTVLQMRAFKWQPRSRLPLNGYIRKTLPVVISEQMTAYICAIDSNKIQFRRKHN